MIHPSTQCQGTKDSDRALNNVHKQCFKSQFLYANFMNKSLVHVYWLTRLTLKNWHPTKTRRVCMILAIPFLCQSIQKVFLKRPQRKFSYLFSTCCSGVFEQIYNCF